MKKTARILALGLALSVVAVMFVGCGGGKKDDGGSGTTSSEVVLNANEVISTADFSFVDADGESTFRIVRPADSEPQETSNATAVIKALKDAFGISPKNVPDSESGEGVAEILVGNTNREETATARQLLLSESDGRKNEFIICTINDDIVIYGMTIEATAEATKYFAANFLASATVTGGIHYFFNDPTGFDNFTIAGETKLSKFRIVRPIYNVSYLTQTETDKLVSKLAETTGYALDTVNDQIASKTGKSLDGSGTLTPSESTEYEIIIGNCVRDGVKTITNKDEYEIRIEGKKIYLNGGSPYATAMAVTEFTEQLVSKKSIAESDNVLSGDYNAVIGKYDGATYYRQTWADDFEGTEINTDLWDVRWGERAYSGADKITYRGNKELKNNYVKDGSLYICALETEDGRWGGLLTTQGMMEYYFGYVEISTIHPKGEGFWTALYTMSAISPYDMDNVGAVLDPERMYYNETDVEECYGAGDWAFGNSFAWPTQFGRETLGLNENETGAAHVNNRISASDDRGFWMDFHTFGFELLDKTKISYTCDGYVYEVQELREGAEQLAYDQSVFLRLAMAAGTDSHPITATAEEWANSNKYIIDYIHVYQHKGDKIYTKPLSGVTWTETVVE